MALEKQPIHHKNQNLKTPKNIFNNNDVNCMKKKMNIIILKTQMRNK